MEVQPVELFRLLMASLFVGAGLGLFYDALRISRVMLGLSRYTEAAEAPLFQPHFLRPRPQCESNRFLCIVKKAVLATQDFLFCLVTGIAVALLLFSHNNGEFRGFVPIGLFLGFLGYYFTVGRLVIRASEYVVFALKTLFLYAIYYITWPIIAVGRKTVTFVNGQIGKFRKKRLEKRIAKYTKRYQMLLSDRSACGFLDRTIMEKYDGADF